VFLQKGSDGRPKFTKAEIRHFLPMAVLCTRSEVRVPALKSIMAEFFAKLALPRTLTPQTFAQAVHAYYRKHPANRELERQFFAFCREHTAQSGQLDPKQVAKYTKAAAAAAKKPAAQSAMAPPKQGGLWSTIRNFARSMG
jgi:hypothetical protein